MGSQLHPHQFFLHLYSFSYLLCMKFDSRGTNSSMWRINGLKCSRAGLTDGQLGHVTLSSLDPFGVDQTFTLGVQLLVGTTNGAVADVRN